MSFASDGNGKEQNVGGLLLYIFIGQMVATSELKLVQPHALHFSQQHEQTHTSKCGGSGGNKLMLSLLLMLLQNNT